MNPISDASFHKLIQILETYFVLNHMFKSTLRSRLQETAYKKGSRILNFHEKQQIVWFMLEGLAREIRVNTETFEEKTMWFWSEMSFLYTTPGFFSQQPSECTIEILKDCRMVLMSYKDWTLLKDEFKETEIVTEKIRGTYDKLRQEHIDDIKNLNTVDRYLKHKQSLLQLLGVTKLKFVAEYMSMSADRLGRLRKKY
ncbi:cyclic nucleotide-binding domain-containing protein [Pedobacter gandavensis]|uniref:Crp/Fnr family transcriptional regulator n=1 Tax=Pedobacter gandavensis TaxID=2679963 RepID=A0ABR6EQ17_9SPHI|nr:hypothetical protein [Pedobacter gandavensis]MBB2147339.1 hypothetical protein [Pedobacter gandavensis]